MRVRILQFSLLTFFSTSSYSQGFGIPSKRGGIGFCNLPRFSGIRFNYADRNVERISGVKVTVWQTKNEDEQTGTEGGVSLSLPLSIGSENKHGINLGIPGVGVKKNYSVLIWRSWCQ